MRIAHVNPFFFPYLGGIERRIYHLARGHAARHEVTVVTARLPGTPDEERVEGFRVLRVPSKILLKAWNPPLLRTQGTAEALRSLDPDVIDYHSRWAPEMTKAVSAAGRPWVFTFHNHYGEGGPWLRAASLLNDRWNLRHIRRASTVVAVSAAMRRDLEGRVERIDVVPNGCDAPRPGAADWQPDDGRPLPDDPYFVTVGRLTPEKAPLEALEAFARCGAGQLVLCGTGPLANRIRRRAQDLGVADRVQLAGWVPEATKFRLLANAAALLHTPRFEAYGIAAAEAIVAGTPVVGYRTGGLAEVVGDAGRLLDPGDVAGVADALRAAAEPGERERLRQRARQRAPALAWEGPLRRMEELYAQAAALPLPAAPLPS
jgi:glycosyltransferase involved in cell wall biosynthesis